MICAVFGRPVTLLTLFLISAMVYGTVIILPMDAKDEGDMVEVGRPLEGYYYY